ncbi:uncharacterized protein LOC114744302 [Neltuma alba]|uniref:uncharacterized protein LOC114744302 n=1 Tax=Neltuma alba TaxID=207710 RepID=UPI0010A3FDE2|nr:uncharacterized protein LOC114744302 [Prosopis alba]
MIAVRTGASANFACVGELMIMMMRRTGKKKQSLLVKLMLSPIRVLKRARQLYMKGVQDCAGELAHGGGGACYSTFPISHSYHPHRTFLDVKPLRARFGGDDADTVDEQRVLRGVHHVTNMKNNAAESQTRLPVLRKRNGTMIRNMGRIDEDKPCNFEEDQIDMKTTTARLVLRPRRSYFY